MFIAAPSFCLFLPGARRGYACGGARIARCAFASPRVVLPRAMAPAHAARGRRREEALRHRCHQRAASAYDALSDKREVATPRYCHRQERQERRMMRQEMALFSRPAA